jgi:membrane protein DedA with SNARE-associated domain
MYLSFLALIVGFIVIYTLGEYMGRKTAEKELQEDINELSKRVFEYRNKVIRIKKLARLGRNIDEE